jgi:hypothetical protein
VKVDILQMYQIIPPPPVGMEEAVARAECGFNGRVTSCDVSAYFASAEQSFREVDERLALALARSQPGANPMANMDPAELQRRIAAMSQAEQIQFAMEMSRQSAPPMSEAMAPTAETPAVQKAWREATRLVEVTGAEAVDIGAGGFTPLSATADRLLEALREKHRQIERETSEAASRVPVSANPSGAEIDAYVAAVNAIYHAGMGRHLAAELEYQTALQPAWRQELNRQRERYANFQALYAAIEYGDAVKSRLIKHQLMTVQQTMLGASGNLLNVSREASESGAEMRERQVALKERLGRG